MNKTARKLAAVGLCAVLCLSGVGAAFAQTREKTENKSGKTSPNSQAAQTEDGSEIGKNETVYVLTGADGSVRKIIVSDWIQNTPGSDILSDRSDLTGIENVKGDEGYTMDGNNMTVWDARGNDIYYQGNIEKELPVNMTVSYMLDGKSVSAGEIAGKSGKVCIRFDYQNMQYETVEIDGKEEKIYVPFAMLTGMLLDSDTFRNVEISNGKLLNDGDHILVVGLAFPGLQENLNIEKETLEIPDYVEITADVTDFALGMTVTLATNEVFNELDADAIDISGLDGALGQLSNAVTQLLDGSSALYDGLCTLLERSDELVAGVRKLAEGAKSLKDGAEKLSDGADRVASGAEDLSAGLAALSANSAGLNGGAEQVFDSLLASATLQLRAAGVSVPDLSIENYEQVLNGVLASLDGMGASEGSRTVRELKSSLDSYNAFYLGVLAYTGGVDAAASGADTLSAGTAALKDGAAELKIGAAGLCDGILTLQDGIPALTGGITQLRDGAMSLNEGMKRLEEEGIRKLVKLVDEDMGSLTLRLKATVDVSKHYTNFSGIGDDMAGQVKFIYRTEEIKGN